MRRAAVVVCCMCCCVCVVALLRGVATPFAVLGRSLSCGREAEAAPRSNQLARPTRHRRPNATATSSEPKRRSTQHTQKGANTTRREHKATHATQQRGRAAAATTTTHHAAAAASRQQTTRRFTTRALAHLTSARHAELRVCVKGSRVEHAQLASGSWCQAVPSVVAQ